MVDRSNAYGSGLRQRQGSLDLLEEDIILDNDWDGFAEAAINSGAVDWDIHAPDVAKLVM